jgi:Domain of unknown function (DUF222)
MFADVVEELMGLDEQEITARFRELELRRRRDEAELLALVAVAKARGVFEADGHRSVKSWLRANGNWSPAEAACACRNARLVNDHPSVGDALLDGHLGIAQVTELGRVRSNPRCGNELGEVIGQLVDYGEQLDHPRFCKVVRRWENLADADGAHQEAERTRERRTASIHPVGEGVDVRASGGDAVSTGWLMKIFDQFVEDEFRADVTARDEQFGGNAPTALLPRTDAQRRFDALVSIFRTAGAMPAEAKRPELVLNLVVSQERFDDEMAAHGLTDSADGGELEPCGSVNEDLLWQYCETENGVPVHGHDIIRAALTGYIRRVVIDGQGLVTDFGRKRRLFNGAAREALRLMLDGCEHIGCPVRPTSCQIDHIAEWVRDNGTTDLANGALKCNGQNRAKHRLGITEERDANGTLVQYRPDGTPILPVGRRLRRRTRHRTRPWIVPDLGPTPPADVELIAAGWSVTRLRLVA